MTTVTALPAAPSRGQSPSSFIVSADAFVSALPTMVTQINQVASEVNANADRAQSNAEAAAATSGAVPWVSGTTYAKNDAVISQVNFQTYRRKVAGGGTTDPSSDPTNWAALNGSLPPVGISQVQGLVGSGSGGNGMTITLKADGIILRDSNSNIVAKTNSGNIVNNASTAGPIANGRDQASAFSSNVEVHYYFIWNGATLATVSSVSPPSIGPVLPSGYTHWAYATTLIKTTGIRPCMIRGKSVFYNDTLRFDVSTISAGSSNLDLSPTFIPEVALACFGYLCGLLTATSASLATCTLRLAGGARLIELRLNTGGASMQDDGQIYFELPNNSQTLTHSKSSVNAAVSTLVATVEIYGYTVPNGDS